MINPDEIPLMFAIPGVIALLIIWRRQVVAERRATVTVRVVAPLTPNHAERSK